MQYGARVTHEAPAFTANAVMPNGEVKEISLSDYKGKYVVLFFYPLDFTHVCPTEIVAFHQALKDFEERKVQLIACSIDSHFVHQAWRNTDLSDGGIGQVGFPMVSDMSHEIMKAYGCHSDVPACSLRALYLIDKAGIIRHMVVNDFTLGRSVDEALRMVDALQFTEEHGEVCPVNWKKGAKGMKPTLEGVRAAMASMKQ